MEKKAPFQPHSCHFQALALWPRIDFPPLYREPFFPFYVAMKTFCWQPISQPRRAITFALCMRYTFHLYQTNVKYITLRTCAWVYADEFCLFENSLTEIWYGTSWNDMITVENTAVIFSRASTQMSSHSCTLKFILFRKIPVETWCNGRRKFRAGRRKVKKGDKSAMILAGSGIVAGGAGDATYFDF